MPWMGHLQPAQWSGFGRIGLAAYLLGCFTSGYYLVRYRTGQDIRVIGSGSVGARNVGRVLGWQGFLLTVLADFAKGVLAIWAVRRFTHDEALVAIAMLAVVSGHIWPFQLRGHGGKGMATALGALCFYDFHLAAAFAVAFITAFVFIRKTILPGLLAFACLPLVAAFLGGEAFAQGYDPVKVSGVWLLATLVLIAHRKNIMDEISRFLDQHKLRVHNDPPRL
ncbi:MAG: glycerol-3-phosphate acyltransferase [Limisphaerales bacterium]